MTQNTTGLKSKKSVSNSNVPKHDFKLSEASVLFLLHNKHFHTILFLATFYSHSPLISFFLIITH